MRAFQSFIASLWMMGTGVWAQETAPKPEPAAPAGAAQAPVVFLSDPARELASVNGEKIRFKDIQEKYLKNLKEMEEKKIAVNTVIHQFTVESLVNEKIDEILMLQEAKNKNISFSADEFEKMFSRFKEKFESVSAYQEYLQKHGITEEDARKKMEDRLTIKAFQEQLLFKDVSVSEEELTAALVRDNQARQIGVWVKISQIMLYFPPGAVEEDKKQKRSRLEEIRREIEGGKLTFADAAKRHSEGASALAGGTVGWMSLDSLEPALKDWASSQKPGALSPVIETSQGVHMALLEDQKENRAEDAQNRNQDIREQVLLLKKQETLSVFVKDMSTKAQIEWQSF